MTMRLSWLVWISALAITTLGVTGLTSHAEAADSGDLIKCDGSQTVYYVGEDNKRYTFPNDKIFRTWYSDFDEIQNVTCEEVQSHTLGGVVKYRQGMRLIKMPSVPVVYAVSPNGILRPIKSEAKAKKLYGDNWAKQIDDLSEAFFPQYSVGDELGEEELPEGMLVEDTDGSVLQVDEDGEVVNVDDVLDRKQKALLRRSAVGKERLEARLGKALSRIQELENEIARLQRVLDRLKAVETRQSTTTVTSPSRTQNTQQTRDDNTKLPDLTVSNIDLDGTAIRATLKNIGSVTAGATHIYFWLDGVLEWTYSSTTLADQSFLLAGGSSFITPQQIVGQRTIKVCVDPLNAVAESSESNNCLTQTLNTGDDGDFAITNVATYMLDALGNSDPIQRTFGFEVSAPMDHFTITVYNPNGSVHDQLVQQVSSPSPLAWYVSPSWLTPMQYSTTYTYTIHAEEYGTGDADDAGGTFVTGAAPAPQLGLNVTFVNGAPHTNSTRQPGDNGLFDIYEFDAVGGDVWVDTVTIEALVKNELGSSTNPHWYTGTDGSSGTGLVVAQDHHTNCILRNLADQSVYAGPIGMYGPYPNDLYFYDQFLVPETGILSLGVECTFNSLGPIETSDGFAFYIPAATDVVANTNFDMTGPNVPVTLIGSNYTLVSPGLYQPQHYITLIP